MINMEKFYIDYTIKNALEDGSVLGFQVEHESTIHQDELANVVYRAMRSEEKKYQLYR